MKSLSHVRLFVTPWTAAHQAPWDFPGKSTGVGCHCLLQIQAQGNNNTWCVSAGGTHSVLRPRDHLGGFLSCSVVMTTPSSEGGTGSIPSRGTRSCTHATTKESQAATELSTAKSDKLFFKKIESHKKTLTEWPLDCPVHLPHLSPLHSLPLHHTHGLWSPKQTLPFSGS